MAANDKRVVKVQKRSGFDKSFRSTLTGNVGTLIPILVDEVIPDTKVNLRINLAAAMPPLVSDTYMNVRLRVEAFAVPHRLCMANFEDFFSDYEAEFLYSYVGDEEFEFSKKKGAIPLVRLESEAYSGLGLLGLKGSLCDYMGFVPDGTNLRVDFDAPVLPFVAYHLIWQEWYRNPRVQRAAFMPEDEGNIIKVGGVYQFAASIPFSRFYFDDNGVQPVMAPDTSQTGSDVLYSYLLADSVNILSLRQRNFGLDYFTAAMVEPQQGEPARVIVPSSDMPAGEVGFTIAALRAQNSIQQFRERNNLTSPRYQQQLYARYGVAPSDGMLQRPALIGAATYDVYSHGITAAAQSANNPESEQDNVNPFGGALGSRSGNGFASGSDFIISGFHAKEPMYIFVLASLVPEVSYSQLLNPILNRYKGLGSITDMANNILQNVGPEPIYEREIAERGSLSNVFAYTDRYSKWMFKNNEIHGEFRPTDTLHTFVLQRHFSDAPEFGSEFLEIPTTYLDDVLQFTSATLGFAYWLDVAFDYRVSMPLQEYAIPSLQDPAYEHGRSIVLRKNGQLL